MKENRVASVFTVATKSIEFDNTQNNANHIHTVVRDLTNDFGEDLLREHYQQHPHAK